MKVHLIHSAAEAKPGLIAKSTVVYGDPLQLGSTVAIFLYHGANAVSVFSDPASAKKAFAKLKRGEGLLAGERDGEKIPGFQMGGAPLDSSRDKVKGRTICLSSPDAAALLKIAAGADKVFLGGFVNLGSVYEAALRHGNDIVIVAAGWDGKPNKIDSVFAGLVADFLQNTVAGHPIELTDAAKKAADEARSYQGRLWELLNESEEGKLLARVGAEKNIDLAAKMSRYSCAPVLTDGTFVRDVPPKPQPKGPGEGAPAAAPRKGKPIKVQVPLFPKNPELPTPGVAAAKPAVPAAPAKGAAEAPKKKGAKVPGKRAPLFSKKTVAPINVKVGMTVNPQVQAATDALKAALSKKDAKSGANAKGVPSTAKAATAKAAPAAAAKTAPTKSPAAKGKAEAKKPAPAPKKAPAASVKKPLKFLSKLLKKRK